jgi:NADPH:quinone reductase-like Zn-dependent oxidoreductase
VVGEAERAAQRGFSKTLSIMDFDRVAEELQDIMEMLASGRIATPPLTFYPLEAAPQALQYVKEGVTRGKVVLRMAA